MEYLIAMHVQGERNTWKENDMILLEFSKIEMKHEV